MPNFLNLIIVVSFIFAKATTKPTPKPYVCDWPTGYCSYYKDPCPAGTIPCPGNDKGCKHKTNRCCCYHKTPPPSKLLTPTTEYFIVIEKRHA